MTMHAHRHVCMSVLVVLLVGGAAISAEVIYEEDFEGQSTVRWRGGEVVADDAQGKVVSITAPADRQGRWLAHPIRVKPQTSYRFSYKVRGIKLEGRLQWNVRCGQRPITFECTNFSGDTEWESGEAWFATLEGETELGISANMRGAGAALIDDIEIREDPDAFSAPATFRSRALVHDGPDASVFQVGSSARVYAESSPADTGRSEAVELTAVRGESAGFQLVLRGKKSAEVSASVTPLSGPATIAAAEIAVFAVRDIVLPAGIISGVHAVAGPNPDPLEAGGTLQLAPDRNSSLFIRIHVAEEIPAGQYAGMVKLSGIGVEVPVVLDVAELVLGRERWLPSQAHVRLPRKVTPEQEERLSEVLHAELRSHGCADNRLVSGALAGEDWLQLEGDDVVIDFSAFDEAAEEAFRQGAYRLNIPPIGLRRRMHGRAGEGRSVRFVKWLGLEPMSPQFNTVFAKYCAKMAAHLREKGWLDKTFMYLWDEPNERELDTYKGLLEVAKGGAPELKQAVAGGATPTPGLYGLVDIWTVNLRQNLMTAGLLQTIRERQAAGEEVGAYGNNRYALDNPPTYMRLWGWTLGLYGLEHTGWWSVCLFDRGDPWLVAERDPKDPRNKGRVGSGSLLYPDPDDVTAIWSSLRWEAMRDGLEDWGLVRMLAETLRQQAETLRMGEMYDADAVLGSILAPVVWGTSETQFEPDAELIEDLREAIIGEIVGAQAGPPAVIYLATQKAQTVAKVYMEPSAKLTVNGTPVEVRDNTVRLPATTGQVIFTVSGTGGQREIVRFVPPRN